MIRGAVKIGRRELPLKGIVRIPTYDKYTIMFICHPEDAWREVLAKEGRRYVNLVGDIITKYRHGTRWGGKVITSNAAVTPLFSI